VGSGMRRIEALTGLGAQDHLRGRSALLASAADRLQTSADSVVDRVQQLQEELAEARRQLRRAQGEAGREEAGRLAASPRVVHGVPVVAAVVSVGDDRALREMGDAVRGRLGSGVIALAAAIEGQARFIVTVDAELVKRGLNAGTIARALGERLGGRGGGRPDSAQGGSKETAGLGAALAALPDVAASLMG
jgi:alanyl-tRNA synthetase